MSAVTLPIRATSSALSIDHIDQAGWENLAQQFTDYSYRQSWAYGIAAARRRGAVSEHVTIRRGGQVIGLADVRVKSLPVVGGGIAYVSGGPLVCTSDAEGLEHLSDVLQSLIEQYVNKRGLTLRVLAAIGTPEHNSAFAEACERAGMSRTDQGEHYRTILLGIDRTLEMIRTSFHSHWRRHLKAAERKSLDVTFGTELERFEEVARMAEALQARKGYEVDQDARFFAEVQREAVGNANLVVGIVRENGAPVAGNITALHGQTAVYLVGASTDAGLACKASYLMHWKTIELAQQRGMRWYDLGGIDPAANPGVTSFKQRTNGIDVSAAGPFEIAPRGLRGRFTRFAENAYRRLKMPKAAQQLSGTGKSSDSDESRE